jgi:hypothetical protein
MVGDCRLGRPFDPDRQVSICPSSDFGKYRQQLFACNLPILVALRPADAGGVRNPMRPEDCLKQAEECLRLMKSADSETHARVLRDLAQSWKRVAGQIDRYRSLVRDTGEGRKGFNQNAAKNP